ncbi:MAG: beta-ketoacyl synthase N-terminal-like domain-containing protein [Candidatus Solibacter sp.]
MSTSAAITGIGCVSAHGIGVERIWRALLDGEPAPRTRRKRADGTCGISLEAPAADFLSASAPASGTTRPSRPALLTQIAAEEAWTASGAGAVVDRDRAGLIVNRNFGQHQVIAEYYEKLWTKGPSAVSGLQFVQTIANSVLGALAIRFRLRGPSTMHFGAPSPGAALDLLRDAAADVFLAGGFDELSDYIFEFCYRGGLTSSSGAGLAGSPYAAASRGLIPSDASVFFVLERHEYAAARGVKPLAWLNGFATVTDRRAVRNPAERDSHDIVEAIRRGLRDAGRQPGDVSCISGAANGLAAIDGPELEAIAEVFPMSCRLPPAPPPRRAIKPSTSLPENPCRAAPEWPSRSVTTCPARTLRSY